MLPGIKHHVLFKENDIGIFVDLYSDKTVAAYAAAGSLLAFLMIPLTTLPADFFPGSIKKAFHPIAYRSS